MLITPQELSYAPIVMMSIRTLSLSTALSLSTVGVSTALRPYGPEYRTDTANISMVRTIIETFPDAQDWQMNPKRLHVVAFVQDAPTGAVLQAVMVGVPALPLPTS